LSLVVVARLISIPIQIRIPIPKQKREWMQVVRVRKNTMLEVDKILEKCGDFSRLQLIMLLLFCVINVLSALHYYSQTIISFVPKYWLV